MQTSPVSKETPPTRTSCGSRGATSTTGSDVSKGRTREGESNEVHSRDSFVKGSAWKRYINPSQMVVSEAGEVGVLARVY